VFAQPLKNVLWWVCLGVAPLILLVIELLHPAGFTRDPGAYQYLSQAEPHTAQHLALNYFGPAWWFTLHMIQTPMVGLIAVGLWLLGSLVGPEDRRGAQVLAILSAIATFVFLIFYTVLDAIGGIGLGRTIEATQRLAAEGQLSPEQVDGVALVLNAVWTDPIAGGVGSLVSQTGSWAVFTSATFLAAALFMADKVPWPTVVLVVGFGWELQLSHTMPHGPMAFGLLLVAAAWIWFARVRAARPASAPVAAAPMPRASTAGG
jgi:hypothetical protein